MLFNVTRDFGKSFESSSDRGLKLDTLHLCHALAVTGFVTGVLCFKG